ncbi:TPT domain-containing protein, partial [Haematococcus lacustris]
MSTDDSQRRSGGLWRPDNIKAVSYGLLNVVTASGIVRETNGWSATAHPWTAPGSQQAPPFLPQVFANKYVFTTCRFRFTYALTWIHTLFTLLGMTCFARCGMFETKKMPAGRLAPLAAAYVAYIVLCNLSLNVNTVGFYQAGHEDCCGPHRHPPGVRHVPPPAPPPCGGCSAAGVPGHCCGHCDRQPDGAQPVGHLGGPGRHPDDCAVPDLGGQQAEGAEGQQHAAAARLHAPLRPHAGCAGAHGGRIPSDTLLGYEYSWGAAAAILLSSALGLGVSLSTFLVIGATSSLTYNVVGHLKTLIILTGGCMFFGDQMPPKKLLGVGIAMAGIVWYTQLKLASSDAGGLPGPGAATGPSQPVSSTAPHQAQAATPNGTRTVEKGRLGAADPSNPLRGGGLEEGLASRSAFTAVHISSRPRQGTTPRS